MRGRKKKSINIPKLNHTIKDFSLTIPLNQSTVELTIEIKNMSDLLKINKHLTEVLQGLISQ